MEKRPTWSQCREYSRLERPVFWSFFWADVRNFWWVEAVILIGAMMGLACVAPSSALKIAFDGNLTQLEGALVGFFGSATAMTLSISAKAAFEAPAALYGKLDSAHGVLLKEHENRPSQERTHELFMNAIVDFEKTRSGDEQYLEPLNRLTTIIFDYIEESVAKKKSDDCSMRCQRQYYMNNMKASRNAYDQVFKCAQELRDIDIAHMRQRPRPSASRTL